MASSAARTEIIYGTPNIINRTLQRLSATSEKIDVCIVHPLLRELLKQNKFLKKQYGSRK
jgi:hypothetical protein